jgi:hypothetical protein
MDDPIVQETSSLPSADNDSDLGTGPATVGSTPHVESRIDHESLTQREHANMEYAEGHESDESARDDETLHHVTTGEDTPSAINVNGDRDTIFAQYTPSISTEERAESSRTDANMPNQSQRLSIEKLLCKCIQGTLSQIKLILKAFETMLVRACRIGTGMTSEAATPGRQLTHPPYLLLKLMATLVYVPALIANLVTAAACVHFSSLLVQVQGHLPIFQMTYQGYHTSLQVTTRPH